MGIGNLQKISGSQRQVKKKQYYVTKNTPESEGKRRKQDLWLVRRKNDDVHK